MKVLHNIKISSTFAASIKEMVTFDGEIAQLVSRYLTRFHQHFLVSAHHNSNVE